LIASKALQMKTNNKQSLRAAIQNIKDAVDGANLLQSLGFEIKRDTGDEIRCRCVIHGGDNETAFRFKKSTKHFSCYTHGCHEESSDIIGLVCAVRKCSFKEALEFLSEHTGVPIESSDISESEAQRLCTLKDLRKTKRETDFEKKLLETSDPDKIEWMSSHVDHFIAKRTDYFERRGFPRHLLDLFEVGSTNYFSEGVRATIPIRDELANLVGVSTRIERELTEQDKNIPKYRNLKNFNKENYLYNLHNAKDYAKYFGDTLILVEGYTGVWRLWQAGIPVGVSCMGVHLSDIQRHYISKHALHCLVMLDGDKAGLKGTTQVEKALRGFVKVTSFCELNQEPSKYEPEKLNELVMKLLDS
jgi:DNA primase